MFTNPQILLKKAFAESKLEHYEQAETDYSALLELEPENVEFLVSLGLVKHRLNKDEEAINLYSKAISIDEEYPDAYINRSITASSLGNYELAEADLEKMFMFDVIFKNDFISTYNEIREIVSSKEDDESKKFLERLEELSLKIKK